MKEWVGSAAVCVDATNRLLMVRGKDVNGWAIPSGGIEIWETTEECCVREVKEETGYEVAIVDKLFIKEREISGINAITHYYKVEVLGTSDGIQDPDETIIETRWMNLSDLLTINHVYPEDKRFLENVLKESM